MDEIWKPIPGYPDYEASNLGRIRSWKGHRGKGRAKAPKILSTKNVDHGGYPYCSTSVDGKEALKRVHVLVLLAFVGPRPKGMFSCHNDGNPQNNVLSNLRYDTPASNYQDAIRHGTMRHPYGEEHPLSKLKEQDILDIRILYAGKKVTQAELAHKYHVSKLCIHSIVTGDTWINARGPISTDNWKPGRKRLEITKDQQAKEEVRQRKRLKLERTREIREIYARGNTTLPELAQSYNLSESAISRLVNGNRYTKAGGPIKGIDY